MMKISLCIAVALVLSSLSAMGAAPPQKNPLAFYKSGPSFAFDTGVLKGTLRKNGRSTGLSDLIHVPTGTRLDGGTGLLGFYRIFTKDHRHGDAAWFWPSTAALAKDGSVCIVWAPGDDHPFEMSAVYRLTGKAIIDVAITVKPDKPLTGFEVFLASYFDKGLPTSSVYVKQNPLQDGKTGFLTALRDAGVWQMFPRDKDAVSMIKDGRWTKHPHPVDWAIRPAYALPLGIRQKAAGGPGAVLMAPPKDCFALSTPYAGEGHYSLYLSLFGRNLDKGQKAAFKARLVFDPALTAEKALAHYQAYMNPAATLAPPNLKLDKPR